MDCQRERQSNGSSSTAGGKQPTLALAVVVMQHHSLGAIQTTMTWLPATIESSRSRSSCSTAAGMLPTHMATACSMATACRHRAGGQAVNSRSGTTARSMQTLSQLLDPRG